ncbi:hypothetical protein EXIGLDRAFT_784599 [Exidia glandulosa HHB12029]|uniref:Reverse transcriptase zinc-binding domain-containing protein n=1 Tax=Exidia glandulosa HHB12029 TaxID=1314781 RepID=A0A166MDF6_EXIGL|nr:hypothetical protein EXIGLDRAFT_784599 [Exidia glandulosa HHB12029]
MPDTDEDLLQKLSEVQVMFIRRSLGVHKRSVLAPLYTETGLIPLSYRRLDFVLRYLVYALQRPADTYVREALTDSMTLATQGHQCWFMDLQLTVLKLRAPFALTVVPTPDAQAVETLRSKVSVHAFDTLRSELSTNTKLYLIRDRKGPCAVLRPYLQVINADHRYAITRLLLSCHSLSVERLRWVERYREKVPHNERLCRFCQASVETPEHVLLSCEANPGIAARTSRYLDSVESATAAPLPLRDEYDDVT